MARPPIGNRGRVLRGRSGRPLKGIDLPAMPPPPPPVNWPVGPYLTVASAHANVAVVSQNGLSAVLRLVTPIWPNTHLVSVTTHNTSAQRSNQTYWGNRHGFLATQGAFPGQLAATRELGSLDWGTYDTGIFQEMSDGTAIELAVSIQVAPTETGAIPAPVAPSYPRQEVFFDDFLPRTNTGALYVTFGPVENTGGSTILFRGNSTAMMAVHPDKANVASYGLPNGLFEFKAKITAVDQGDGTGPALILWPADDVWPSVSPTIAGEIDLGEMMPSGVLYYAIHTKNEFGQDVSSIHVPPQPFDQQDWHIYGCRTENGAVTLYADGAAFAQRTDVGAPDFHNGGVNRVFGVLNASSDTLVEVDWIRWTPQARLGPLTPYPTPIPPPTVPPPATPTPGSGSADVLAAQTFLSGLTMGVNVERGRPWYLQYQGVTLNQSPAYWSYLKGIGVTHVRLFYPYRPTVNMSDGVFGTARPTAAQIDRLLDAAVQAVQAGLRVFYDCCDVMGIEDFDGGHRARVQAHVDLTADRVLLRPTLSPASFAIGPVNEWAGGENTTYNGDRIDLHNRLASKLPNHVLVTGAAGWCSKEKLLDGLWEAPTYRRFVAQFHNYEGAIQSDGHWAYWMDRFREFRERNAGIPVYCGEAGYWDFSDMRFRPAWVSNQLAMARQIGTTRPTFWAVTDGNDFRMNVSGTDVRLIPELEGAMVEGNAIVQGVFGYRDGTDLPGGAPPAGPVFPDEPTWDGATVAMYHDFPGTVLDRGVWRILYGGVGGPTGAFDWDHRAVRLRNPGLTIETFFDFADNRWKTGGISLGDTGFAGFEGFMYGQVSIKARMDAGQGYGIGLILWPADNVWTQEIDIAESPRPDKQTVLMTVHGNPPATVQDSAYHGVDMTQWHVYTVRWEPAGITFYVDGVPQRTVVGQQYMPTKPMGIGIQGWVYDAGDQESGGGPTSSAPKRIEVAYVRRLTKAF